jgi:hypothetical protein
MEIWEQTDEQRIATAQARWVAEFERRHTVEHGPWRPHTDAADAPNGHAGQCAAALRRAVA